MISRSYTWIEEDTQHSDVESARAAALAKKWSELQSQEEERRFARERRTEEGDGPDFETEEEEEEVEAFEERQRQVQAERDLEIELIEDKLADIGARLMRPYEHWNEDERYMQYMENRSDSN